MFNFRNFIAIVCQQYSPSGEQSMLYFFIVTLLQIAICAHCRPRSACVSAQSTQDLLCSIFYSIHWLFFLSINWNEYAIRSRPNMAHTISIVIYPLQRVFTPKTYLVSLKLTTVFMCCCILGYQNKKTEELNPHPAPPSPFKPWLWWGHFFLFRIICR